MTRIGSLFAGIGGLELGIERAIPGASVAWQVEIDPFCRRVLERHWPQAVRHDDVCTFPTPTTERVDVICGGFPCQDLSVAGRGAGLDGTRSGLFFEYVRVVRALRPRVVVMENVAALLARGLGRVLGELAACGYDAEWDCIPASAVGAPHQRDRLFIVAHAVGHKLRPQQGRRRGTRGTARASSSRDARSAGDAADADGDRCEGLSQRDQRTAGGEQAPRRRDADRCAVDGKVSYADSAGRKEQHAPTVAKESRFDPRRAHPQRGEWGGEPPSAVRRVDDGISAGVDRPRRRRPVNDRRRLHALGNAVVPQVAEVVGRRVAKILEVCP